MKRRIKSTKQSIMTMVLTYFPSKRVIWLLGLFALCACKKQQYTGTYNGVEYLTITSSDTIYSSFYQSATIEFSGSNCHFNSSTLIWEFDRKQKVKTGYLHDENETVFSLEFKDDSLIANYLKTDLDYSTQRIFRKKK